MDGSVFFLSLSPHDPWSVACPMQGHLHAVPVSIPLQLHVILFRHATSLPWSFQFFLSWFLGLLILSLLLLLPVLTTVSLSYAFLTFPPTPCIPHLVCLFCSYCSQTCLIYSLLPPVTKTVLLTLRLLVPIYFPSATLPDLFLGFFGFEVGNCYSMLLDTYKGDGAKYRRWVTSLLSLISRPGSDMACISCEAVDEPWMRPWNHRKWGAGGTASHPQEHLCFLLE